MKYKISNIRFGSCFIGSDFTHTSKYDGELLVETFKLVGIDNNEFWATGDTMDCRFDEIILDTSENLPCIYACIKEKFNVHVCFLCDNDPFERTYNLDEPKDAYKLLLDTEMMKTTDIKILDTLDGVELVDDNYIMEIPND